VDSQHAVMAPLNFAFDGVLSPNHDQEAAYAALGAPAVEALVRGESSYLIALGALNAGKTYSLYGPVAQLSNPAGSAWMEWGLLPRACHHFFSRASAMGGVDGLLGVETTLSCSFIEIRDEVINDLLGKGRGLRVRESAARGVHVPEATQRVVEWEEDVMRALVIGLQNRTVGSGEAARGSHTIFTLTASQRMADGTASDTCLQLVEMGAAELPRPGSAVPAEPTPPTTKSVATLTKCLAMMAEGSGGNVAAPPPGEPNPLSLPYRDSRLTWLLRDALGCNVTAERIVHTSLLACCSVQPEKLPATIGTLRFGHRCRHAHLWVAARPEDRLQAQLLGPSGLIAPSTHLSPTRQGVARALSLRDPASDSDTDDDGQFVGGPTPLLPVDSPTKATLPADEIASLQARLQVLQQLGGAAANADMFDDSDAVQLKLASAHAHMLSLEARAAQLQAQAGVPRS